MKSLCCLSVFLFLWGRRKKRGKREREKMNQPNILANILYSSVLAQSATDHPILHCMKNGAYKKALRYLLTGREKKRGEQVFSSQRGFISGGTENHRKNLARRCKRGKKLQRKQFQHHLSVASKHPGLESCCYKWNVVGDLREQIEKDKMRANSFVGSVFLKKKHLKP